MRKVVFGINITTDGYCSHEDGIVDAELHNYFTEMLRKTDIILYGRKTYELMVPYWPDLAKSQSEDEASNEFARVFDSLDLLVFSTTLKEISRNKTRIARGNIAEELITLKNKTGKDIAVGSLSIASQLSDLGLIDEYHFVVHPVVAGKGPRLFETLQSKNSLLLDLISTKKFQTGVIALHYKKNTKI